MGNVFLTFIAKSFATTTTFVRRTSVVPFTLFFSCLIRSFIAGFCFAPILRLLLLLLIKKFVIFQMIQILVTMQSFKSSVTVRTLIRLSVTSSVSSQLGTSAELCITFRTRILARILCSPPFTALMMPLMIEKFFPIVAKR
jgi:hypothetical protein